MNPLLLAPGQTHPGVAPLATSAASPTQPLPATLTPNGETVAYFCEIPAAVMHRTDGKKIPFLFQFYETNILHDILYLEDQIAQGNTLVRHATDEEKDRFRQRTDPRGLMKEKVRAELQQEIGASMEARIRAQVKKELGVALTPEEEQLLEAAKVTNDEQKLQTTETLEEKLKRIKAEGKKVSTSGNTTVIERGVPAIKPVSTADLAGAQPTSGK